MRIAFTIIFNGLHHLQHNNYIARMKDCLDWWVFVEGLAIPTGSTRWCRDLAHEYPTGLSSDGTTEFLEDLDKSDANVFHLKMSLYNKDQMVNAALEFIKDNLAPEFPSYLWQIDADEQWNAEQLDCAEADMKYSNSNCGCFYANYYVGPELIAKGYWGEGRDENDPLKNAYRRLWLWNGRLFESHEPPKLIGGNGKETLLKPRFDHYAYYFQKDIEFKEKYYGYDNLLYKWLKLQKIQNFPIPISELIDGYWATTKTYIEKK